MMIREANSKFKNIGESSIMSCLPLAFLPKPLIKGGPVFICHFFAYYCQQTALAGQRLLFHASVRCRPHSPCIDALRKAVAYLRTSSRTNVGADSFCTT